THDTKRAEDVRARLAALSELPGDWAAAVERWHRLAPLADPALAHLVWQAAVGAWPIERERLAGYAEKAAREASVSTSWTEPSKEFETALRALVDRIYDDPELHADLAAFAAALDGPGWSNGLGQKLVQLAMPGVPDVYQGAELWDTSLVDPDNRRPVDFARRRELLARLDDGWQPPVDASGAAKLLVVSRVLRLRRDRPELFGDYRPVRADGAAAEHLFAFDRGGVVAVCTRLPIELADRGGWRDTSLSLPGQAWLDQLTGRRFTASRLTVSELLDPYPVALLVSE
ncbi:MAG TPA: malto-oligosyltrehalose synthase, partial [Catenuloplanes sp.]